MDSSNAPLNTPEVDDKTPMTPASEAKVAEDAEERLARSRDRNREHARRTRLRKKAQLQVLQSRVKELQNESRMLRQTVEECSIASILLGLSGQVDPDDATLSLQTPSNAHVDKTFFTMTGKRKRFVSDACDIGPKPMKLKIKGQDTLVGGDGKAHINWKTGVYLDENGEQKQLSPDELETLRRERNRMHAKMTRDRKKLFISSVEKTIADLEKENQRMRDILSKQATLYSKSSTKVVRVAVSPEPQFPIVSPMINSVGSPQQSIPPVSLLPPSPSGAKPKEEEATDSLPKKGENLTISGIAVVA